VNPRVLIVDDEPLARQSIRRHLQRHADVDVIGECGDGGAAVLAILAERPDLVFLDVQMPEIDGFQVIERVGAARMPSVIFATAWDHYALQAFDASAVDYLLKPFRNERFDRALARARSRIGHPAGEDLPRLLALFAARADYLERIPVVENGRIIFVNADEIDWIESAGNYARLHAGKRCHEIRETLSSLEARLDPKHFVRVHRSAIVNVRRVREVHPWFHGYHLILLESGEKIRMSRYQHAGAKRLGLA
jgi:two-component system LytT family response regulator